MEGVSGQGEKIKLYRLLLEKYSSLINENEEKTIGEIKSMVNGEDLTVQSLLEDFKGENFSYEKDYLNAAKKAFEFVRDEISFVEPEISISYWLSPKEILSEKVADDEDIAVFLCSLFSGLGDTNASVVISELSTLSTHAFVVTERNEKFYLFDATQKHEFEKFCGKKEEVLQQFSFNGAKIKKFLYKFNKNEYKQFV